MAAIAQGRNANQNVAGGAFPRLRLDNSGAPVISRLFGYSAARQGQIFHANSAVDGVAPGTSIGTTGAFALFNPDASHKWLVVLEGAVGLVSGTLAAGTTHWISHDPGTDITGTACVARSGRMDFGTAAGQATETATVPAGGTLLRTFDSLTALVDSTAAVPWRLEDKVGGRIIIPPGYAVSIQATAGAGTSPLLVYSVCWAEVAIPSS